MPNPIQDTPSESKRLKSNPGDDLESNRPIPALFPSIASAAAGLYMQPSLLKWAKKNGCDAFDAGSRVKTRRLLAWLHRRDDEQGDVNWHDKKEEYQAKREEIKLRKESGQSLDRPGVSFAINRAMSQLFQELDRDAKVTLPPDLKGREPIEIERILLERNERLKESMRRDLKPLTEEKEQNE